MKLLKYLTSITLAVNLLFIAFTATSCASKTLVVKADKSQPYIKYWSENEQGKHESIIRLISPKGYFYCTGFVVDENYALTAAHCVVNNITGSIIDEDVFIYDSYSNDTGTVARTIAVDLYRDVAFIKGNFKAFKYQKTDFYGKVIKRNMKVQSCGYPSGMVSKFCVELTLTGNKYFQYRAKGLPIFKGMSGGVVIDVETGYAVGVNSAVDEDTVIISPLVGVLETVGL